MTDGCGPLKLVRDINFASKNIYQGIQNLSYVIYEWPFRELAFLEIFH